jgi:DNA polymerase III subunit beta
MSRGWDYGGGIMKVTCTQQALAHGLATVSRAVATRSTLPILSNILLESDDNRLKLSATNLEIGISCWLDADVRDPGRTTVPARLLSDFVTSLPEGKIDLDLDGRSQTLKLASDRSKAEIRGIDAADFPLMPTIDDGVRFSLDPLEFRSMITQTIIAAAQDDARPVLTGILFVADPDLGRLTLAAADGFRLSVRDGELDAPLEGRVSIIVPSRALAELQRIAGDEDDRIEVAITPNRNQILFQLRDVDLVSQLLEGNFPDYEKIIPSSHTTRVVVNAKALHGAVRMASFFARDAANVVRLTGEPGDELGGTLTVTAQAAEVGGNESELQATVDGDAISVAFNAKYMLDVLSAIGTDQVAIELAGESAPGVFRPVDDTPFTHVIMPMHIAH